MAKVLKVGIHKRGQLFSHAPYITTYALIVNNIQDNSLGMKTLQG